MSSNHPVDICPACSGQDPHCPTCYGNGWVEHERGYVMSLLDWIWCGCLLAGMILLLAVFAR